MEEEGGVACTFKMGDSFLAYWVTLHYVGALGRWVEKNWAVRGVL